jgi:two-component system, OmpR family, response regulator BaeR
MNQTILVVEDEIKIADLIGKYLILEGYQPVYAVNGNEALALFARHNPALIVLDIMLPELNGLEVCERLRAISNTPIILLTARVQDVDRLIGFASGADDYVCKPFNPQELMARIKAVLRRTTPAPVARALSFEKITIIETEHSAQIDGVKIQLTQIEFRLLTLFTENPYPRRIAAA